MDPKFRTLIRTKKSLDTSPFCSQNCNIGPKMSAILGQDFGAKISILAPDFVAKIRILAPNFRITLRTILSVINLQDELSTLSPLVSEKD